MSLIARIDDVIAEARWVVENPSPRNIEDLRAALAALDRVDVELIPGRDDLDEPNADIRAAERAELRKLFGDLVPMAPCELTPDGS